MFKTCSPGAVDNIKLPIYVLYSNISKCQFIDYSDIARRNQEFMGIQLICKTDVQSTKSLHIYYTTLDL